MRKPRHQAARKTTRDRQTTVSVVILGFGRVGRAFFDLAEEKSDLLRDRYGLNLKIQAALKSDGGLFSFSGLSKKDVPACSSPEVFENPFWKPGLSLESALKRLRPGVVVACTSSDFSTGEPGLGYLRRALRKGWNIVTADKGPLAADFRGIKEMASRRGLGLRLSGAAAAALPALDVGLSSLAGAEIQMIEGILNGTTNSILTEMARGRSYIAALREAQAKGIAEPDPAQDVEGWDTAVKLMLIGNAVMGLKLTLSEVRVKGIAGISGRTLRRARREGKKIKLIGKIRRSEGQYKAQVGPVALGGFHPLFAVDGTNKGITFLTDTMGAVTVTGGKSDPRGAAAALLKDLISIFRKLT